MAEPCKCHRSHAYITPTHSGHCCFYPASQNCHPEEAAAWVAEHERLTGKDTPC